MPLSIFGEGNDVQSMQFLALDHRELPLLQIIAEHFFPTILAFTKEGDQQTCLALLGP